MLHESIRHLVATHGPAVLEDADQFRALLDDVVEEDEATSGQINLLVDAVRLGAVRRLLAVLSHGATEVAALDEAGNALARDRGSEDSRTATWALAILGYAAGCIDDSHLLTWSAADDATPPAPEERMESGWWPGRPAAPPTGWHGSDPFDSEARTVAPTRGEPGPGAYVGPHGVGERARPALTGAGRARSAAVPALLVLTAILVAVVAALVVVRLGGSSDAPTATPSGEAEGGGAPARAERRSTPDDPAAATSPTVTPTTDPAPEPGTDGGSIPDSEMLVDYFADGSHQIYAVGTESPGLRPITVGADDDELPSISPDRSTIAFVRKASGSDEEQVVWLADADGSNQRLLYDGTECTYSTRPGWSLDGTRIAVACFSGGISTGLYVSANDGSGLQQVLPTQLRAEFVGAPTWISDHEIVYGLSEQAGPAQLWRLDLDTGDAELAVSAASGWDSRPDWSPEAREVLFLQTTSEEELFGTLMAYDPATGAIRTIPTEVPVAHPVWSSDGSRIAVCVDTPGGREIGVLDPDSSSSLSIIEGPPGATAGPPVWGTR